MTALDEEIAHLGSVAWRVWTTKSLSIGAILVQWLELFHNLPDEIEFLWMAPLRLVTCLYAWSRYFPIFAQGINFVFSLLIHRPLPDPRLCMVTYVLKAITAQLVTTSLEAILALRVYALYGQSKTAGVFLVVIMLIGTLLEFTGATMAMAGLEPGPGDNICIPGKIPRVSLVMFIAGWVLIQSVLLLMTLLRSCFHRDPAAPRVQTGIPVVSLMMRDGAVVFVFVSLLLSGMSALEFRRDGLTLLWPAAFSWYVTLVSIAGCRIIMNMRKLAYTQSPRGGDSHSNLFSTFLEGDSNVMDISCPTSSVLNTSEVRTSLGYF